jgi:uncharacterized LabA/DUF88 family protein
MEEPQVKRAVAFFDGQNLYRHAKEAFGHHHSNYDPKKLFDAVCKAKGWQGHGIRFYTGTPIASKAPIWHAYWSNRLLTMRRAGILVTSRPIRYRNTEIDLPDGTTRIVEAPQEKGIDIRIALDVVRLTRSNQLDVAVIFSQDQDLVEVVQEVREIARSQQRWVKVVSAFPSGPNATAKRGIDKTDWVQMDQDFYDACLDSRDYRPKKSS